MGRTARILLTTIGAIVVLFIVAAIAFRLFFDPNDFREDIAKAVKEETGRDLVIEGDIELQLFPWLAIEVGQTSLGNAEGFGDEPFLQFERAQLSVRLLPLILRQEATVGSVALEGLFLNLQVDRNERRNWSDLLAPSDTKDVATDVEGAGADAALEISGVDISNATIVYEHRAKGDRYELSDANLTIGRVSDDGSPIPINGGLTFDVQPAALAGTIELDTEVAFDRDSGVVSFGESSLQGLVEGFAEVPARLEFETAGIEVSTTEKTTTVQPLRLSVLGIDISADVEPFSYAGDIQPVATIEVDAFSPRSIMTQFGAQPPETADPSALSSVRIESKAYFGTDKLRMTGLTIKLDDTTFTGKMTVPFASNGRFIVDLAGGALDLNRYMAPAAEGDAPTADETAPVEIPAELIRALNASGKLKLASVTLGQLLMENVELSLNAGNNRLRIHPISAALYGGSYQGDVRLDVSGNTPVLSMNENINGVDLAKLGSAMFQTDQITGSIQGNFRLSGRGADMDAVQRTLNGTMQFELSDGVYSGMDVWWQLRRARALLKKESPPPATSPAQTTFSSVRASGTVKDGVMRNDDFAADLGFMQISGAGSVDLPAATVDYSLNARISAEAEGVAGATPEEVEDFTKLLIPLKISGPIGSPSVAPDVEAMLRQRAEEEIKDRLKDKLKGIFD